uniref:Deoxyribonuclease-2 n=1 Tax=Parastrongyloides trichosuri TaxID=131310 RepID=A0A0N4ZCJ6_PARTI
MIATKVAFTLLLVASSTAYAALSCKDQNGNPVDYFLAYKMPKITGDNSVPGISDGLAFYYLDANSQSFSPSTNSLDSQSQAFAYTLNQLYQASNPSSLGHFMWNDELPASATPRDMSNRVPFGEIHDVQFGHTKGTLFFDETSGVYLIHSIPKFPEISSYSYPSSGHTYGQSALCITINYNQVDIIGKQLYFNHPQLYNTNLPTSMASANLYLSKVLAGQYQTGSETTNIQTIKSRNGVSFTSFAKSADFNQDLYDKLVAPNLKAGLAVETWRRGDLIPLDCSTTYKVADVETLQVSSTPVFKYTKDHSKVAISEDISNPYICIGDINRMTSQYVRGGGTTCFKNQYIWNQYSKIPKTTDSC